MRTVSERCKGRTEIATDWWQQSTWTVSAGIQTAQTDAADVQMVFPMEAIAARVPDAPQRIKDWVTRVHARPAYQRALERGGPYTIES